MPSVARTAPTLSSKMYLTRCLVFLAIGPLAGHWHSGQIHTRGWSHSLASLNSSLLASKIMPNSSSNLFLPQPHLLHSPILFWIFSFCTDHHFGGGRREGRICLFPHLLPADYRFVCHCIIESKGYNTIECFCFLQLFAIPSSLTGVGPQPVGWPMDLRPMHRANSEPPIWTLPDREWFTCVEAPFL